MQRYQNQKMEEPGKKKNHMEVLIPGYDALMPSEKRIAETFMKWFVDCAKQYNLLELCESAARSRFDKIAWFRIMQKLYSVNPEGRKVTEALKKMIKIPDNAFLMITAKMEQIVAVNAEKQSKETTHRVRIDVSQDIKDALN